MNLLDMIIAEGNIPIDRTERGDLFEAFSMGTEQEIRQDFFGKEYKAYIISFDVAAYDKPIKIAIGIPKHSIDPEVEQKREHDPNILAFERELEKFRSMLPALMKSHPNKFVAVLNGKVVDHDKDELRLANRVYMKYPREFILIREVKKEIPVIFAMESPEGVGR
ncbi:MAG: hypothetical protein ABIL62_02315 [Planctomycetota bacterium]